MKNLNMYLFALCLIDMINSDDVYLLTSCTLNHNLNLNRDL